MHGRLQDFKQVFEILEANSQLISSKVSFVSLYLCMVNVSIKLVNVLLHAMINVGSVSTKLIW